jgi:hypothetical protein
MRFAMLMLIPAALVAGCSPQPAPEPGALTAHPVTGKVVYDGQPAAGVVVTLLPIDAPMVPQIPHNPRAVTKDDGSFTIGTFREDDGAPEGGYQIVLTWPGGKSEEGEADGERDRERDVDRLKGWYDGTHSTLNYRVKGGQNAIPDLFLPKVTKPPPHSQGVPGRN